MICIAIWPALGVGRELTGVQTASKRKGRGEEAVTELRDEPPSNEEMAEFKEMLECARPAKFIVWEDEDQTHPRASDSGVPCGTELPSQGGVCGWEICERCISHPLLKCVLSAGFKPLTNRSDWPTT